MYIEKFDMVIRILRVVKEAMDGVLLARSVRTYGNVVTLTTIVGIQ